MPRLPFILPTAQSAWIFASCLSGGVDESVFPQELVVEHVRVYQCSVDPATGDGCDTIGDDYELVPGHQPPG